MPIELPPSIFDGPPISQAMPDDDIRHHRRGSSKPLPGKRRDIQGLRMVAVVAVVVNHLTGHPQGGFVGVDVFFVISGFLITSHLLRDLERPRGPIAYIGDFYRRRVRRLFPAALVVIGLTFLFAHAVFTPDRYHSTLVDGGWASIFWANWHLIDLSTNYFNAGLPESPLQHYWSLSVEEQFYVVWPVVLFLLVLVVGRKRPARQRRTGALVLALALCAASLTMAFAQSSSAPTTAYFSTFTRGWELGLGAVLAALGPFVRVPRVVLSVMSLLGLALIGVSLFVVHGGAGFPAPGAILPTVGAALVIAAVSKNAEAANPVLTNPAAVFVGDISYSVYLVHLPVIILLAAWMGTTDKYFYVAATALLIALSIALYAFVEQPVLNSRFLLPRRDRANRPDLDRPPTAILALAAFFVGVVGLGALAVWPGHDVQNSQALAKVQAALTAPSASADAGPPAGPAQQKLTRELSAAINADSYPEISPPLGHAEPGIAASKGCTTLIRTPQQCSWGDKSAPASRTIYLVGDSTSTFYDDGFIAMMKSLPGWRVRVAGGSACAFADEDLNRDPENAFVKACPKRNINLVKELKQAKPGLLVVTTADGDPRSNNAVQAEVERVKSDVGKIVILQAPVAGVDPRKCFTPGSVPLRCLARTPNSFYEWSTNEQRLATRLDAAFIDPLDWSCVDRFCPAFVGHTPMHLDQIHITAQYAALISPVILEAFRAQGLLPKQ